MSCLKALDAIQFVGNHFDYCHVVLCLSVGESQEQLSEGITAYELDESSDQNDVGTVLVSASGELDQ